MRFDPKNNQTRGIPSEYTYEIVYIIIIIIIIIIHYYGWCIRVWFIHTPFKKKGDPENYLLWDSIPSPSLSLSPHFFFSIINSPVSRPAACADVPSCTALTNIVSMGSFKFAFPCRNPNLFSFAMTMYDSGGYTTKWRSVNPKPFFQRSIHKLLGPRF